MEAPYSFYRKQAAQFFNFCLEFLNSSMMVANENLFNPHKTFLHAFKTATNTGKAGIHFINSPFNSGKTLLYHSRQVLNGDFFLFHSLRIA